jgi:uncharacterized membrane protein
MDRLVHWLEASSASEVIQKVFWVIPTVQTVHILAISVVFASMAMLDMRLLGLAGTGHSVVSLARRFLPWLWSSLVVLAVTGSILIVGEPHRALGNLTFTLKMAMLATAIAATRVLQSLLKRDIGAGNADLAPAHAGIARVIGLVSLLLWIGIIVAGRLIAYTGDLTR